MMGAQRGAVVVMMLAVVVMLSLAIGTSLTWVETGISSVGRAEANLVIEESMIAAIRIASVDTAGLVRSGGSGCGDWAGRTYPINELEVGVTCEVTDDQVYLRAELGARWLLAEVEPGAVAGDRWRVVRWTWPGQT
jgi:hypothetical protein